MVHEEDEISALQEAITHFTNDYFPQNKNIFLELSFSNTKHVFYVLVSINYYLGSIILS